MALVLSDSYKVDFGELTSVDDDDEDEFYGSDEDSGTCGPVYWPILLLTYTCFTDI
jgi:hypothetical protein